jgi:hypothetical protein
VYNVAAYKKERGYSFFGNGFAVIDDFENFIITCPFELGKKKFLLFGF